MRRLVLWMATVGVLGCAAAPAQAAPVISDHYVPVGDGASATTLRMRLARPEGGARVPTLLAYHGYGHGLDARPGSFVARAVERGYAVAAATVRGAGCSGGRFDFLSAQEARDGKELIEWIATQPWSDGEVAMYGDSYTGFEQLPVAALRPRGLVAIAPGTAIGDLYRDVAYPGGISNTFLPAAFSAVVLAGHAQIAGGALAGQDQQCAANQAQHALNLPGTPAAVAAAHRWDDATMRARAPGARISDITVPLFTVTVWQDQTLGSRGLETLARTGGPFHAVLSNGGHGYYPGTDRNGVWYSRRAENRLFEFLDHYVKGVDNGFDERDPVEVWWETQRQDADVAPRWTSGIARWPAPAATSREFFLSAGRVLRAAAGTGPADSYRYVGGSGQFRGDPDVPTTTDPVSGTTTDWSAPAPAGQSLTYTSAPLEKDLAVLGTASLDLWLSSTAPDTDLQAVLTEVRPDGREVYVQAGYLRASHRALDPSRSTPARPFHTHRAADTQALVPGVPSLLRLEIPPVGHMFRRDSRLRLWIDAPPRTSGLWGFDSLPGPSVNSVYHDALRPSVLRLSTLPGHAAAGPVPTCGTLLRQPCRAANQGS